MENILKIRRLGCDNWTEEDFKEDAHRNKTRREIDLKRKEALVQRGWDLHVPRCSRDTRGEYCIDPTTKEHVSYTYACQIQEEREPGSIPKSPVFSNDWEPPTSDEFLIHQENFVVQPMKQPFGLIFYMDANKR